jgi:cytochrome P450
MRATFFPFGQGIRNCIGEGFAWTESTLLLADGAAVHPVLSSTLVPSGLPMIVTRRR